MGMHFCSIALITFSIMLFSCGYQGLFIRFLILFIFSYKTSSLDTNCFCNIYLYIFCYLSSEVYDKVPELVGPVWHKDLKSHDLNPILYNYIA